MKTPEITIELENARMAVNWPLSDGLAIGPRRSCRDEFGSDLCASAEISAILGET